MAKKKTPKINARSGRKKSATRKPKPSVALPSPHDWRTTDEQEIEKRRLRAREDPPEIRNLDPRFPIFSDFEVKSSSGMSYRVEIRDLAARIFSSSSPDFRVNGLGTDKHVEAVLEMLQATQPDAWTLAEDQGSPRIDIVPDPDSESLRVERGLARLPDSAAELFDESGRLYPDVSPEEAVPILVDATAREPTIRISQEVESWLTARRHARESRELQREYERKVHSGEFPSHETKVPLYPYQREGALHLAFRERALLADEMGLGKTIQAHCSGLTASFTN